jgi:hypothetical protein
MEGFRTLQDMKYSVPSARDQSGKVQTANVGVLSIDDPSWGVLLDFIKSDTAIVKSERNEPANLQTPIQAPPPVAPPTESPLASTGQVPPPIEAPKQAQPTPPVQLTTSLLQPINFQRIKTIISVRIDVLSAGSKPRVPPYNLVVLWPPPVGRRVYEFVSFEEFRLDLRHMMLEEMEELSLWISVIAFACGLPINALRMVVISAEQRSLSQKHGHNI